MNALERIWEGIVADAGQEFSPDMLERGEQATDHALALQVRALAGEDVTELQAAVASSFANLRSQGATALVGIIRKNLRVALQEGVLAVFGAISPVGAVITGGVFAALSALDADTPDGEE